MATQPATTVADVLDKAADLIAAPGAWTQMDWGNRKDCFCMLGAVAYAAGVEPDDSWYGHLADYARGPLSEAIGVLVTDLPGWNDEPERTQEQVIAKLKEAAALAREQGK